MALLLCPNAAWANLSGLGTFRPSVAAGMERDAFNAKQLAAAVKLGGACVVGGRGDFWKQRAGRRQLFQDHGHVFADGQLRLLAGFHPKIRQAARLPVDVIRRERGGVALR